MFKDIKINCRLCQTFNKSALFEKLTNEEAEEIYNKKKSMFFKKGEMLLEKGDLLKGVYCLRSGKCKLFMRGFNGKEQILRIVQSGDIIGQRSLLINEPVSASIAALEDTWACFIPESFFKKILYDNHELNNELIKKTMKELGEAGEQIMNLAQRTVRERLAFEFLRLEREVGVSKEGFIAIALTREEMANLIGTATETIIRLISEFKTDKLIESKGRYFKIINKKKLEKLSSF